MKYLLYFTPDRAASPSSGNPVADNKAAVAYIAELQKKGILETAYAFVTGGGIRFVIFGKEHIKADAISFGPFCFFWLSSVNNKMRARVWVRANDSPLRISVSSSW